MGYSISQMGAKFFISREHHKEALAAIRTLFEGGKDQSWVKCHDAGKWTTLGDALANYGYHPRLDEDYNIVDVRFGCEKMGDEDKMFKIIAPFVKSGSYIEMTGDEGAHWRWVFKDGVMTEIHAKVPWEDDE